MQVTNDAVAANRQSSSRIAHLTEISRRSSHLHKQEYAHYERTIRDTEAALIEMRGAPLAIHGAVGGGREKEGGGRGGGGL